MVHKKRWLESIPYSNKLWTLNQWQHVVCTVDESGVMKLFRNGELGSVLGHLPSCVTRSGHLIGKSHWSNNHYFRGSIDDLRFYERAISTFEADQIFKGDLKTELMLGGEDPNVFVYWGDEDAGQITDVNSTLDSSWDARVDLGILSLGQFSTGLVGLQPGKTYYYRVFASNSAGSTSLSEVQSFSTGSFEFRADSLSNSNFLLWLDANDINGDNDPTNEPFGGTVDKWFDKSGLNLHAGNGNGPELLINNLNGLPVLKFDGLNNYLRVSNSNSLNVGEEITLFVVAKGDTLSDWRPVISKKEVRIMLVGNSEKITQTLPVLQFVGHPETMDSVEEPRLMEFLMFGLPEKYSPSFSMG